MAHELGFLWAVTAVVWLGTLAYIVALLRRQNQLQRELDGLQRAMDDLRRP